MRESVQAVDALVPPALRAVVPALVHARDELRADLQSWLATAKNGADRFTAADKQAALRALEGALDRVKDLHPAMASALAGLRHATGPLAISNLDNEIRRLSAIFGGGVPVIPNIKAAAIIAQGDKLLWKRHETSAKRYAGAIGEDVKHLLSVGVAKGESFDQLVNRLRRIGSAGRTARPIEPGADSAEIAGGLFGRYRWWAERLVRTEGMNTYNVMHDESIAYADENRPDGDEEYLRRWDAAADPRTCPICTGLDGKVTTLDGTFPGGYTSPPAHSCCRCVVLAWQRRWGNMKGETQIKGPVPTPGPARSREASEPEEREPRPRAARKPELPEGYYAPGAKLEAGLPAPGKERERVYVFRPSDIDAERLISMPGGVQRSRMERVATAKGQNFGPINLTQLSDGRLIVEEGRHRLLEALESGRSVAARVGRAVKGATAEGLVPLASIAPRRVAPDAEPPEKKKNAKRVEAAKKAAAASVERRREIHSAVASNLPQELQSTWDKEGHKFMQQEAGRIHGVKDPINAASKISEAFAEQYAASGETGRGYEGDRYHRRAEIEAKHAEAWADEQESKYYAAAARAEQRRQPAMTSQRSTPKHDDDVPF